VDVPEDPVSENKIQGELLYDGSQETPMGPFYRIVVAPFDDPYKTVSFPVLASPEEIRSLDNIYLSRSESDSMGDFVELDLNTGILSLDELVLTSGHIKKIDRPEGAQVINPDDVILSNGMRISTYAVRSREGFSEEGKDGKKYSVMTGYGEDYDIEIFDFGDGKPYRLVEKVPVTIIDGKIIEGTKEIEKRFKLTYRFCDVEEHPDFFIWDPTGFRSDPCYGTAFRDIKVKPN